MLPSRTIMHLRWVRPLSQAYVVRQTEGQTVHVLIGRYSSHQVQAVIFDFWGDSVSEMSAGSLKIGQKVSAKPLPALMEMISPDRCLSRHQLDPVPE